MRRLLVTGLLMICAVPAAAVDYYAVSVDAAGFVAFVHLDSDRNGYVSRVEARSVRGVEGIFDSADVNRDGLLDRDEYTLAQAATEAQ